MAGVVNNLDMQFQASLQPEGLVDIRVTDRDVILVRKGVSASGVRARNYAAAREVTIPLGGKLVTLAVRRGYVVINGEVKGTPFRFVTTHLETEDDPAVQGAQVRELLDTLQQLQAADGRPLIVAGDFNSAAPPAAPVGQSYLKVIEAGFVDHSPEGFTCCFPPSLLGSTVTLSERIDFIFTRSAPNAARLSLLAAELVGEQLGDRILLWDLWPSDHAGVVVRLKVLPIEADSLLASAR